MIDLTGNWMTSMLFLFMLIFYTHSSCNSKVMWQVFYDDHAFLKLPSQVVLYMSKGNPFVAVPIGVIASFRKMKKLTKDTSFIVAALKESALLVSG